MLKTTSFIIALALFCNGLTAFALDAPRLSVSTSGVSLSLSWTSITSATGYTLYYAPYPYTGPETINSVDMGAATNLSATLWDGAAYYVAVTTRDGSSESGYSNIESFTIDVTEEDLPAAECDKDNLGLCSIDDCSSTGGYWYNNTCNEGPIVEFICDADHLDLCDTVFGL